MKSIRRQLTLTMLCGFGLLVIFSSLIIYFLTRIALLNEFDSVLRAKAFTIMSLAEQGHDGIQVEIPHTLFPGSTADENSLFFELWRTNGTVCARSESLKDAGLPFHFGSQAQPLYWNFDLPNGFPGRAIGLKFIPQMDDEDAGKMTQLEAIVTVAADRRSLDRTLDILGTVLVVSGLLTIIITIPMVNISLRRGHAPLEELAQQAETIKADSLKARFPVDSLPEELRPIAGRLNDLLQRLESSFERERRFSADIAHELRTPLAELRTLAEVELKWPDGEASEKHPSAAVVAIVVSAIIATNHETTDAVASNREPVAQPVSRPAPAVEAVAGNSKAELPAQPVQAAKATIATQSAAPAETAPADEPVLKINGYVVKDPEARLALSFVGTDPAAEAYWSQAINDPNLPSEERKDLIEDLNEDGLTDPKNPTAQDMPIILSRIQLIEEMAPQAMDPVNAKAFAEAYKDLVNLYNGVPVR